MTDSKVKSIKDYRASGNLLIFADQGQKNIYFAPGRNKV
jgi:hypothetical protein